MATISSHILDSTIGKSASGIRVQLFQLSADSRPALLFDIKSDHEGRISESIVIDDHNRGAEFELVMHSADYFSTDDKKPDTAVKNIVIRFVMDDDDRRYHMPVMLSPYSYSTWYSG